MNMQITHEEARRLIHFASDANLKAPQKETLDSHLESCLECQEYADSIRRMEVILYPLLQKQWKQEPIPLSMNMLLSKGNSKLSEGILLATRIAAVGVMFMVFMFSAWQFTMSKPGASGPRLVSVPPIPVPSSSTQFVSTKTQSQTCGEIAYSVQENDTLESIATQFATSKEEIRSANHMKTEIVTTGMKLIVPVCNFTPTGTANTLTITFTPILRPITSTPGG